MHSYANTRRDWKKLTFFYYAHSYVNFNILVTELFKIYKTRIWMSAINPASLSSPLPAGRGLRQESGYHRDAAFEPDGPDMDPAGAIPPNINPTPHSFHDYNYHPPLDMAHAFSPPMLGPRAGAPVFAPMTHPDGVSQGYWPTGTLNGLGVRPNERM